MSISIQEVIATLKYRQVEISKTIMMLEAFFPDEEPQVVETVKVVKAKAKTKRPYTKKAAYWKKVGK